MTGAPAVLGVAAAAAVAGRRDHGLTTGGASVTVKVRLTDVDSTLPTASVARVSNV